MTTEINRASLEEWMQDSRLLYASEDSAGGRKRIYVALDGCFSVMVEDEEVYDGRDIDRAIEVYNAA